MNKKILIISGIVLLIFLTVFLGYWQYIQFNNSYNNNQKKTNVSSSISKSNSNSSAAKISANNEINSSNQNNSSTANTAKSNSRQNVAAQVILDPETDPVKQSTQSISNFSSISTNKTAQIDTDPEPDQTNIPSINKQPSQKPKAIPTAPLELDDVDSTEVEKTKITN
jgi:hypothetical protein